MQYPITAWLVCWPVDSYTGYQTTLLFPKVQVKELSRKPPVSLQPLPSVPIHAKGATQRGTVSSACCPNPSYHFHLQTCPVPSEHWRQRLERETGCTVCMQIHTMVLGFVHRHAVCYITNVIRGAQGFFCNSFTGYQFISGPVPNVDYILKPYTVRVQAF